MSRFVLFSSVIAASSNRGQSSYAMTSIGSDLFASFRNRMGSCGASTSLGAIAAVGYAARFSASHFEVPFDHTVNTFGMVVSNVAIIVVVTVISGLCKSRMEDDLDELCWGVHAQAKVNPHRIVSRDFSFVSSEVFHLVAQSQ